MEKNYEAYISSYLDQLGDLTPEEVAFLHPKITIQAYPKKEFLLKSGDIQRELAFILKGLVRRYYINDKGNEISTGFNKEDEYVTDYPSFIRQKPTKYFLQGLEPSLILSIPYDTIQECYKKFDSFQLYGRMMAEQALSILSDRMESFLFNTAEERYVKFMVEQPDLMKRVSLTHLSSLLGIERQSLSRIRKRLRQK